MPSPFGRAGSDPAKTIAAVSAAGGTRGRPRKINRDTVTHAALGIVEREGLSGLTMRRVADELGVGLATLYNAVGSKEAILDDMIDAVFDQLPVTKPVPGEEVESLLGLWSATHELLAANPAVAQLAAFKPIGGPALFGLVEATLSLLRAAGVEDPLVTPAFETIRGYTIGTTLLRTSRQSPAAIEAERELARASAADPNRYPEVVERTPELQQALTPDLYALGLRHLIRGFLPA